MTAAPAATQPNALERYRQLKADLDQINRGGVDLWIEEQELMIGVDRSQPHSSPQQAEWTANGKKRIAILTALRDVLVERLNEGQAKIYTKRTIDTPSPATADMEEKWVLLLEEYRTVTDELHSLAPQLAVEAYAQSLKAAAPAKSNGARPTPQGASS